MGLQVVGAGVGRTGTASLKGALEQLLGGRCYHMMEVFGRPEDVVQWDAAYRGELPDWDALFDGFTAAVDWPMAGQWQPISEAFPNALILLSVRDADAWWRSASDTIFNVMAKIDDEARANDPWARMSTAMMNAFTPGWQDEATAKAAYLDHNEKVRSTAPADRLLEWHPGDGWEPICERLGLAVPDEEFPHTNTTEEFRTHFMA